MNIKKCRLCLGSSEYLSLAFRINKAPKNIQNLLKERDLTSDQPVELNVLQCRCCGFVQIQPFLSPDYYDEYEMGTSHSRQMQRYQEKQAKDFIQRFNLVGKKVKEIGCGDGSFMEKLNAHGADVSGVEPSGLFRKKAIKKGFEVEDGYVDENRVLEGSPCDAFVTRQVLEHVPNIHSFLRGVYSNLADNGVGLIEVPSLEKAIKDQRFYDFFTDHVNYFSKSTLTLALNMNGFEVIQCYQDMHDEYNVAIVRKRPITNFFQIENAIDSLGSQIKNLIDQYHSHGCKVAIWGSGGKGLSLLASSNITAVDILVDSDLGKQGLYTPVTHLKVQDPTKIMSERVDAVIISAMAYHNEIQKVLREDFGFKGDIYLLGHHLQLV